jgi:hypothetical protein
MKLAFDLPDDEIAKGFTSENDIFDRADLASRREALLLSLEHGSVCLLDGRWGTGKSTFVRQWSYELQKHNVPTIYFDAFASDYIESPFQAIAGSFVKAAIDARRSEQPAYKNFLARAAAVGKVIGSVSAKVSVKAATLGAVSASDLGELGNVGNALTDGFSEITEAAVKRLLEEHASKETEFRELRSAIESLPGLLRPILEGETSPPLIVFIDELDRCRPDFSLGVLETLKHFFHAKNVHFVLVTNSEHLKLSIAHKYGAGKSANEYLQKFYDFVVHFDITVSRYGPNGMSAFINSLTDKILPVTTPDLNDIRSYIHDIVLAYRLTLRQAQVYATNVAISYVAARDREFRPSILVSFLALMKTLRPEVFQKARTGSLTPDDVDELVHAAQWTHSEGDRISMVFRYHLDENIDVNSSEWRGWGESMSRYNIERTRVIQYLATNVIDRFGSPIT